MVVIQRAGMCSSIKESKPGRYEWSISLSDDEPTYTWITENDMAWRWAAGGEYRWIFPCDFDEHDCIEMEAMMIMDSDVIESQDKRTDLKGYDIYHSTYVDSVVESIQCGSSV